MRVDHDAAGGHPAPEAFDTGRRRGHRAGPALRRGRERCGPSKLKIDRSFVADIGEHEDALAIVASTIDLARAVGVDVIVEGVETAEQAALIKGPGCVTAQGRLWSPAVSMRELLSGPIWLSPYAIVRAAAFPGRAARRERRGTGLADGLRSCSTCPR
ncbi:EAL domain-containing protein [Blastococcus sp. CT_GayMR19]|uniref:EAL domain-containing protein n=1 Tax=Blastococcus sp. CT_GayMR19 TaxID=2559608 RepID=UPI001ADDA0DB|nr:EAL domain-containing protein [Blastococcus sp. CT_GayMR19]